MSDAEEAEIGETAEGQGPRRLVRSESAVDMEVAPARRTRPLTNLRQGWERAKNVIPPDVRWFIRRTFLSWPVRYALVYAILHMMYPSAMDRVANYGWTTAEKVGDTGGRVLSAIGRGADRLWQSRPS